jgi:hypothetical protein
MSAINIADFLQFDPNAKEFWHVALFLFALLVLYRMITNGDFAARVLGIGVILFGLWFLSGCSNGPTDPLGATSRTRLRTDASVSIAQADANARIAQAHADEAARIAEANALIITEQSKQNGATARTMAWATTLPIILLIVGGAVVVGLIVNWQGRIWLERTRQAPQLAERAQWPQLNADQVRMLQDYARRSGQRVRVVNGEYFLEDTSGRQVKALLKG